MMDNSRYKKYEPIFGSWYLSRLLGRGSFGEVYEITRDEYGTTYKAALKIISVPQDEDDIKTRMTEGKTRDDISEYYDEVLKDLIKENEIMSQLKGNSNIVSYEDHQVFSHDDGIGHDILIRMELLTPLIDRMLEKNLAEKEVVKLGIDICKALELCHKKNIIHRDIKPQNIFISENGDYKLGDFGIARTIEKTLGGMSRKGTYNYMAPEVFGENSYDHTADIYSLGMVMYVLLNGNRGPFLPAAPEKTTPRGEEEARVRRFRGEPLPAPKDASPLLGHIILKACAANPQNRYRDASQLKTDLELYLDNYDAASVGSISQGENETVIDDNASLPPLPPRTVPAQAEKKRSSSAVLWVAIGCISAVLIFALLLTGILIGKGSGDGNGEQNQIETKEIAEEVISEQAEESAGDANMDSENETGNTADTDNDSNEDVQDMQYEIHADSGQYTFYFDTEDGSGDFGPISVGLNEYFTLPASVPSNPGLSFAGWRVERLTDNKWYSHDLFTWIEWDGTNSGDIPTLYDPGVTLLFDDSWGKNGGYGSNYVFHAVWR